MATGRCLCGNIKVEFEGKATRTAICHCDNCKHYTGSLYSHNLVVPSTAFKVLGTPKEITLVAASGKSITNCFCGDCGTTLFRYGDSFGGFDGDRVVQAGVLASIEDINNNSPELEMFVEGRVLWVPSLEGNGVRQFEGMPPADPAN